MVKISLTVPSTITEPLEVWCCETGTTNWGVEKIDYKHPTTLFGYFENEAEAAEKFAALRAAFPQIPAEHALEPVRDCDWQNEYKKFLTAWQYRDLDWVPLWQKGEFKELPNRKIFYFDAGLAFGTGDHPTTRLCAMSMLDYIGENKGALAEKSLIDAGCGSGILSLTAKLYGFGDVYGFDRDPEAVRASIANAQLNNIPKRGLAFERAGIERALENRQADIVVANIISDVLCIYADNLAAAVKRGGSLILSGILAGETGAVQQHFASRIGGAAQEYQTRTMGEWARLEIKMKE